MKSGYLSFILFSCVFFLLIGCSQKRDTSPRVLVFTKTAGFHHASIADGVAAIQKMGKKHHFTVDTTSDAAFFVEDSLRHYSAVIFLNTTGNVLNHVQQADFKRYIQSGGGYVGVHAASDCEYHWPWYGQLVGAYFDDHPRPQEAKLVIHKDSHFPVTDSLPQPWKRKDEWYNFRKMPKDVNVLVSIDENSYEGGTNGAEHPMVWYHHFDGGRSFYMELGHTPESYSEKPFLQLLWAGIKYAIGDNLKLDYSKATQLKVPDEGRFSKNFLGGGLNEPTELTVLPDLSVLIAERKGGLMYYNAKTKEIKQVAHLDVYHHTLHTEGVNVEMGFMGLQADPNYKKNHWVYAYYSPVDTSVDRLSRFKFWNGKFDLESEQVILEVHTRREICCHTGGSIAFDSSDNLYLSVGDNTTPFDEKDPETGKAFPINTHGFAPLDDRPGFAHYDDRRAAGNSNDLRGKILRIHVNKDGSYSIPDGNLFPKDKPKTRPEIYVMGDRNPYRISVDQHTGYLYWGEVGPDAAHDSLKTRGPRGYDEINQAKKAGNFGWPYFIGDNIAYHLYDYATGTSGAVFDPNNVVNNSRNNTGIKVLPSAQPAFIWYPYDESSEFPILGSGGRTAMAGPVYYVADYPDSTRFPEYYNGKLFIYDWIRNWIMVVTMDDQGNLLTIEPFMKQTDFHNIIDMEVGPDGRIYVVEYGEGWFTKNPDAGLSVITYNRGNRPPQAEIKIDSASGVAPLTIQASANQSSDPDGDKLSFSWNFGDDSHTDTGISVSHTYEKVGVYPVSVTVSDPNGGVSSSKQINVYVGNNVPKVSLRVDGNSTFYFPHKKVAYHVEVTNDRHHVDTSAVEVAVDYYNSPDKAALAVGHQQINMNNGKALMASLDCQACHKINEKSVGPSFKQVALRYTEDQEDVVDLLSNKIMNGGSGNWGETAMPAHPALSGDDAKMIVEWVLTLNDKEEKRTNPMNGSFIPADKFELNEQGTVIIYAAYTGEGGNGAPALTGSASITLRAPVLEGQKAMHSNGVKNVKVEGQEFEVVNKNGDWISFADLSLEDIDTILLYYIDDNKQEWKVTIHQAAPDGQLVGEGTINNVSGEGKLKHVSIPISSIMDEEQHDLYFVFQKQHPKVSSNLKVSHFVLKSK